LVGLGEQLPHRAWIGVFLVTVSVLVVARQAPPEATVQRDQTATSQRLGLICAVLAVLCGVSGAALSRSVLIQSDLTPLQSAATRLLGGLVLLLPWLRFNTPFARPRPRRARWPTVLLATLLGTNLGILLQQVVLQRLPLGLGVTLLSTAPVMALLVAGAEGDHPRLGGVLASLLAVSGVALAVLS
jgi:drug/metabolite transporter (DMT)-like permease